ncbi:unnamed protein product [Ectocarpus sp. 12 AP-2014]
MAATIVKSAICRTRTSVHRPNPTMFYFPGLSSRPWHDPASLPWCQEMEKNVPAIRAEYENLVHKKKAASDYDTGGDGGEHKLHSGQWDWHSYVLKGRRQEVFRQRCPLTASLLDGVADHMVGTPFSFSFFSTLHGGSSIAAHTAPCNLRLRCHLPLTVPSTDPSQCGMRVGGETRPWEEGKCIVFDDCYEHEVWNKTDRERVLLLFDLWHPDLAGEERNAVTDMFGYAARQGWLRGGDNEGKT